MSGKGSSPRPFDIPQDEYANRWGAIFGKKEPEVPEELKESWVQLELPLETPEAP